MIEAIRHIANETRSEWRDKDRTGKLGAVLANIAMTSRAAFIAPLIAKSRTDSWTWKDTALATGAFASDFIDGWAARRLGGETTFGAIADPIFDKAATTTLETLLAVRGELDPRHVAIRSLRDYRSTCDRTHALLRGKKPNATRAGKTTTALRMTVDVMNMSPVATRRPQLIAGLQEYTTKRLVTSGRLNRQHYREENRP